MNPVIYNSNETQFESRGLGTLADCISCSVWEERNGEFELEMKYPVTGVHFSALAMRNIILAKPNQTDDPQPFRIYKISKPISGMVTVYAHHIRYDLAGYVCSPFEATSAPDAFAKIPTFSNPSCPFTFTSNKDTVADLKVTYPKSISDILAGTEGSILDTYGGGEYTFDKFSVRYDQHRGADHGVVIRYGKNLTDIKQEEECSNVYTAVYPYWLVNDELVTLPEKTIAVDGTFDYSRVLPLDLSSYFEETPDTNQLRAKAQAYITNNNIGIPKVNITLNYVQLQESNEYKDLALFDTVRLCDTVHIRFEKLGVDAEAKCIRLKYNVLAERTESVEFGDSRSTLSTTVSTILDELEKKPASTQMQEAINTATKLITGGLGGYVLMHSSAGYDYPDEFLILGDSDDLATAQKVWRFNRNGLGYSSTGYNGTYGLAMTSNGQIVADKIVTGILGDQTGENYWNMETGEMRLSSNVEIGASGSGVTLDTLRHIYMDNGTIYITDGEGRAQSNIYAYFNSSGLHILNHSDGTVTGHFASSFWSGDSTQKGLTIRMETGRYVVISRKYGSSNKTLFGYYDANTFGYKASGFRFDSNVYINSKRLYFGKDVVSYSAYLETYKEGTAFDYSAVKFVTNGLRVQTLVNSSDLLYLYNFQSSSSSSDLTYGYIGDSNHYMVEFDIYSNFTVIYGQNLSSSDERLKDNISPKQIDALYALNNLDIVSYDWMTHDHHVEVGITAQDVECVAPDLIGRDSKGFLSIDYIGMIPYLIRAIQQLTEKVGIVISPADKSNKPVFTLKDKQNALELFRRKAKPEVTNGTVTA